MKSVPNSDDTEAASLVGTEESTNETPDSNYSTTGLRDRHLFSALCYRNFAHLPEITFIESVQRCATYRKWKENNHLCKDEKEEKLRKITELEWKVLSINTAGPITNGMLWSIGKLFTGDK